GGPGDEHGRQLSPPYPAIAPGPIGGPGDEHDRQLQAVALVTSAGAPVVSWNGSDSRILHARTICCLRTLAGNIERGELGRKDPNTGGLIVSLTRRPLDQAPDLD